VGKYCCIVGILGEYLCKSIRVCKGSMLESVGVSWVSWVSISG